MKNILITGITGQDGKYLTKKILEDNKDHIIYGLTRKLENKKTFLKDLNRIGIEDSDKLKMFEINLQDKIEVSKLLKDISPDIIFNLAGPSSVYGSLNKPEKTKKQITKIFENLTTSLIENNNLCNFFQASSSEMFAGNKNYPFSELSEMAPNSPYADAKIYCHNSVVKLNKKYGWNIVSGIMFNHESGFRNDQFLLTKIINNAINASKGNTEKFEVGSLEYTRDWMHVEDTVNAIYKIAFNPKDSSYIIGSGKGEKIKNLIKLVFLYFGLDYREFIQTNPALLREGDSEIIISNPKKLQNDYMWKQKLKFEEMISKIIKFRLENN